MTDLRICPTERLAHSVAPSVCGWNAVDINSLMPNNRWVSFQNLEVNFESLSDTIEWGNLCKRTTSLMYNDASSEAVVVVLIGIRCTIEVNLQMTTQRSLNPCDLGNGPIKSIPIELHGRLGIGNECRRPIGLCVLVLDT